MFIGRVDCNAKPRVAGTYDVEGRRRDGVARDRGANGSACANREAEEQNRRKNRCSSALLMAAYRDGCRVDVEHLHGRDRLNLRAVSTFGAARATAAYFFRISTARSRVCVISTRSPGCNPSRSFLSCTSRAARMPFPVR